MKLFQRIATSSVLIGVIFFSLFGVKSPFLFSLLTVFFIALALAEFFDLLKKKSIPVSSHFGLCMGVLIPWIVYMEFGVTESGEVLFLVLGCLFLFILKFFRNTAGSLSAISLTLFGILYISWFLSFLIKIRFLPDGAIWVAYLLTVTKAADIGAYLVGTSLGKHALIPHISPKKSIEGLTGGLLASVLTAYFLGSYLPLQFLKSHILLQGLVIGIVGQIGDLSESMMKRFCDAKDSGSLLPGMGGVLDGVDSILFTAPIFYFHLKVYL